MDNLFGKDFKVLKELPKIFKRVSEDYPEYFWAYEEDGMLEYCIIDDNFGQPSPANYHRNKYAEDLRYKCHLILEELLNKEYIEIFE